jgi:hypothetical protein
MVARIGKQEGWKYVGLSQHLEARGGSRMTPEQRKVILDYATELQTNDEPWRKFEYYNQKTMPYHSEWLPCSKHFQPLNTYDITFRRRPKTITVTMPVPPWSMPSMNEDAAIYLRFKSGQDAVTALAAIRAAMEDGR